MKDLKERMAVWTMDASGARISGIVVKAVKVPVPPGHQMVHLFLDDSRELFASLGHPTAEGRRIGDLCRTILWMVPKLS